METKHLLIRGRVQGVFFRQTTQDVARKLDLSGWVRNLPSGDVEIKVQGPTDKIERLIVWAHDGPRLAKVTSVEVENIAAEDLPHPFTVRH